MDFTALLCGLLRSCALLDPLGHGLTLLVKFVKQAGFDILSGNQNLLDLALLFAF